MLKIQLKFNSFYLVLRHTYKQIDLQSNILCKMPVNRQHFLIQKEYNSLLSEQAIFYKKWMLFNVKLKSFFNIQLKCLKTYCSTKIIKFEVIQVKSIINSNSNNNLSLKSTPM